MSKYTDGPLRRGRGDPAWLAFKESGPVVHVGCGHGQAEVTEIGDRIMACWNACQGIPTEALSPNLLTGLLRVMQGQVDSMDYDELFPDRVIPLF